VLTGNKLADKSGKRPPSYKILQLWQVIKSKQGNLTRLTQKLILVVADGNHQLVSQICDKAAQHRLEFLSDNIKKYHEISRSPELYTVAS
jgi:hypothetical protein